MSFGNDVHLQISIFVIVIVTIEERFVKNMVRKPRDSL